MYVPPLYRPADADRVSSIIERYPLATLVTNGERVPWATHLPVIADPQADAGGGLVLLGHMNRANPHWAALATVTEATLLFTGPHSYITPLVYQTTPAAPTWNFVAVHLQGTLELIDEPAGVLDVVRATVAAFESRFGGGWDDSGSVDYFRKLAPDVGAWRYTVTHADTMLKLSQEKPVDIRRRVAEHLAAGESGIGRDLAALMTEHELEETLR